MNATLKVCEDLDREPGYSIVTVSGLTGNVERLSFSISRHGYDVNYMGQEGWQAALEWLEPEDAWYENGKLGFVIPPEITWQMDPQGYLFKLRVLPNNDEIDIEFFWPDVLPAEAGGLSDDGNRLLGTKVRPVVDSQSVLESKPESVTQVDTPDSEPTPVAAGDKAPVPDRIEVFDTASHKSSGANSSLIIGGVLLVLILASIGYWLLNGDRQTHQSATTDIPSEKPAEPALPIVEETPVVDLSADALTRDKPSAESEAAIVVDSSEEVEPVSLEVQLNSEPAIAPVAPKPSTTPATAEIPVLTELVEVGTVLIEETEVQPISPVVEPLPQGTEDAILEVLGGSAEPTSDDLFRSIEPAIREKTGE